MIPFVEVPPLALGSWRVYPFHLLVIAAVLSGHFLFLARARRQGIDTPLAAGFSLCAILGGFIGSHLVRLAYNPGLLSRGWIAVVDIYNGMSSFGGLFGALGGMALWFRLHPADRSTTRRMADSLAFAFPFAWIFGRLGCTIAHDHPGIRGAGLLAVAYPDGPRYDLGLLELLFIALIVAPLFLWLDRKPRPAGFYPGLLLALYGAFRLLLDRLHENPPRYFGIAMDQWCGAAALLAGAGFLLRAIREPPR